MRTIHAVITVVISVCALPAQAEGGWFAFGPGHSVSVGGGAGRIEGSGKQADEVRALAGFHALRLSGPIDVRLKSAERERVSVRTDDNLLPLIETRVRDGTLEIGLQRDAAFHTRNGIVVTVEFQVLDAIAASGSGDVHADRIRTREFNTAIAGSNDIAIDALEAEILAVSISGSGDFRAGGHATTQGFSIAGSGDVNAAELEGARVAVKIAGSGDAKVYATESLAVSIAGSGDVRYRGTPQLAKSIAGSGVVEPLP